MRRSPARLRNSPRRCLLLEHGHTLGASSRLYAIFDGMRAVLHGLHKVNVIGIKTHHGMFRTFERLVIASGQMAAAVAAITYSARELRWNADYSGSIAIDSVAVAQRLHDTTAFIEACRALLPKEHPLT